MAENEGGLFNEIRAYYAQTLSAHGDTPRGVDWNGEESQIVRFEQLCKIIDPSLRSFSLNDLGCGYGALVDYLRRMHARCSYLGVDICEDMISAAEQRYATCKKVRFFVSAEPDFVADYSVASGVLNVSLGRSDVEWFRHLQATLDVLDRTTRLGFAFNCLTAHCDEKKKREHLFYADPEVIVDLCERRYSRQVTLLDDYGLYEFTVLVSKG